MNKFLLILFCSVLTVVAYSQTDSTAAAINNAEKDTVKTSADNLLPVFGGSDMGSNNNLQGQDVSTLLGSSRDIFYQAVAFHFIGSGGSRFRMRGYNQDNFTVVMNGMRLNSLQTGGAAWNMWGGMTNITRLMEVKPGIGASRSTFGDVGGYFNLNAAASSFRKGLRVAYTQGNRIYKERVMVSYSTGMLKNGWAFAVSGTARYSDKGYIPGTFFTGFGYFLGADKKINDKNTLSLIAFGAPQKQGAQSTNTDEAYALAGDKHYNENWGYQNGQIRNATIRKNNVPTIILTDTWVINDHSKLTTNASYSFGRMSSTNFNFYGVLTPAPTYYKYMPSYYGALSSDADPGQYAALTAAWQNNTTNPASGFATARQIDWDGIYNFNYNNLQTVNNVDGIAGKKYTGKRSLYIIEDRRQDVNNWGANAIYNTRLKKDIYVTGGINGALSQTRYYKVIDDLLGGDYWLDLNQFANSISANPNVMQYNIKDPNKLIRQGDVFGYDYNINVTRVELWGQAEKSFKKFDAFVGATANNTSFFRIGHMVNGLFPSDKGGDGSSGGNSKTLDFMNYGVKAGITYKINGHNYLTINGSYSTKPPLPTTSFVSPRSRNDVIPGIQSENILSGDISYNVRLPWLKGRITYYYTQINNQAWQRSYFDDVYKTNVNYFMTNLNQLNQGLEIGLEGIVTKRISIIGALAYGSYLYTNRPSATISADNTAALLASNRTIYLKNYHVGGAPEVAGSIGVRYNGKKFWYAGVYCNYFANNYVTINPDRRTQESLAKYVYNFSTSTGDPQVAQITDQEKLANTYTLDFMGGKSFRFKNKTGLNISVMVNNFTNNVFKTAGQEQLRHDINNITKFPNKYSYSFGLTYMASVSFTFN